MKAAFKQPGFPLLFAGLFASMVGDSLMLIVLAIWVKELTGSNGAAGLTFFFMAAPSLLAPLFGVLVDRVNRRNLLIWENLASAAAMLPLLAVDDRADVWIIYLVAVCYGISFVVSPAALNGLLKDLLPEADLVDANASLSTTKEALRLGGPLAGAGLFTLVGGGGVALVDAATFVVAAVAVALLSVAETPPERAGGHWSAEFLAGIRHIRSDAVLAHTLVALGVALLVIGFMESALFAMVDAFERPASFIGVVISVQGVGAVAGGIASSRLVRRLGEAPSIVASLVTLAAGLAVCAVSPKLSVVFAGVAVLGFALPLLIVAFTTLLQRRTPNPLMGRVSAAADVVLGTPQAVSIALGALLVTVLSYRSIYWICAAVIVASAGYLGTALRRHRGEMTLPSETASQQLDQAGAVEPVRLPPDAG